MRSVFRGSRGLLAAGVLLIAAPSCTLLVDFVDQPLVDCEAGECLDAAPDVSIPDAKADAGDTPDVLDADTPDVSALCKGKLNGFYCGYNGLNGLAPSPDDLVHCVDGGTSLVLCDAGCVGFPAGYPDRCSECTGKATGYYCGSQFTGYGIADKDVLLYCAGGKATVQMVCANGCAPGAATASCK